mmetsp:Transcript_7528/g.7752  ORF Transcript_7528/g.7752 Transcript_7528/m.7752 type:complete len:879 (+) Transcript_7528:105-2741(+)|eukprot:CAMPEP_0182419768 /NCGR_PEP_ID=MMETSP1167-20130531/4143_1 /TAXON_ID=2988 /ORGANISM="Mallomonas Sp, Strain CCMP3275" /LENGTH=878 /DNA_ID=CAMNT_0024594851 /DNA_START=102 /DNA_END=2738 /DNA_ORIENTATION=-
MNACDRVVLPLCVSPRHYAIQLTPDLERLEFDGSESIDIAVLSATKEIKLHTKEIHISDASFKGTDNEIKPVVQISYNLKDTTVTLEFSDNLPLGDGVLSVSFRGVLNGDMAGFYKSNYTGADGTKKVMASTQFEAIDARRAFPCWDEPLVKATFAVTLIIPSNLTALSNMPQKSLEHLSNGKKKVIFDVSPTMSTYLLAWAVGEFDFVEGKSQGGVTTRVFSPPGRAQQGMFALDVALRALDYYDNFFKVKYPLPKLDMLCVTEFAAGAMENWGLVTYREVDLMINPEKASSQQKQRVAIVVTHELAHQWFGNLVTMQWWDDLWLNEGFAAYCEHMATNELFPEYHIWEQYTTDAMGAALRLDSLRSSHPIQVPIVRAEEVEQVFDAISYCKGSTVVRMVAALLGPDKFQEGLQLYMKRHQYKNTVTADLWAAWSEVSGVDVDGLMASWTKQMGYPYLTVVSEEWSATSVTMTLEQKWFLSDGSALEGEDANKKWSIPLLFATSGSVSSSAVIMSDKRQTFTIPLAGVEANSKAWVKINAEQKALVRVAHTSEMSKRLQPAIRSKVLGPEDRAALLLDAYAIIKAGNAPVETVVELLQAYDNEDNSTVWSAIHGVLGGLNMHMEQIGGPACDAFKAFAKRIVRTALAKVGWTPTGEENHTMKLMRTTVLGLVESFCYSDEDVVTEARRRFAAHWDTPSELPSEFKSIVYRIVLKNGGETEYDAILTSFTKTEDNQERKYVMGSLGAAQDPKLKKKTMDWTTNSPEMKLQDFFYAMGSVASSNQSGSDIAWTYFKENVELMKTKLAKASPSLMDAVIVSCVSRFCTNAQADEMERFFAANPIPQSARRISQTVESIRNSGAMLERVMSSKLTDASFWQ